MKKARESLITNDSILDIDFTEVGSEKMEYEQTDIDLTNYEVYSCSLEEIENLIY